MDSEFKPYSSSYTCTFIDSILSFSSIRSGIPVMGTFTNSSENKIQLLILKSIASHLDMQMDYPQTNLENRSFRNRENLHYEGHPIKNETFAIAQ